MIRVERRPMTAEERAWLAEAAQPPRAVPGHTADALGGMVGLGAIFGLLACLIPALILRFRPLPPAAFAWCGGVGAALGALLGLWLYVSERREDGRRRAAYQRELFGGQAEVLRCEVGEAVELVAASGEGPGYFLDVGDGQVLFLQGSYLWDFGRGEACFPSRQFEIVRAPQSSFVLSLHVLGPLLEPSQKIGHAECDWDEMYYPHDGEVLAASLPTLVDDLRRLHTSKSGPPG